MGYNDQTESISDTSKIDSETLPWSKSTLYFSDLSSCDESTYLCGQDESKGAGDLGFMNDYKLVNEALGTLYDGAGAGWYCIASRNYSVINGGQRFSLVFFGNTIWRTGVYVSEGALKEQGSEGLGIRPVLTFKATNIIKSGDGKSAETAYTFE